MNPVIMHVNYGEVSYNSYGDNTVDGICRMAAELGFDGIEFRGNPPKELDTVPAEEYIAQIAVGKKKYGLSQILFSIGIGDCASEDEEVQLRSIQQAIEKARLVNDLCGTTLCNTFGGMIFSTIPSAPRKAYEYHGSAAATQIQWDRTVDAFCQVGRAIAPLGIQFAFETHMNYIHDLPAAAKRLVDDINSPAIGINMDFGNTMYFPEHPSITETIDLYGDKLFYTHLKNSVSVAGNRVASALAEGEINHRTYLKKLRSMGFTGPIGIEAPRVGDRFWYAQQDLAYFKSVINSIN